MTYQRNETPEPLASATPITEAFEARLPKPDIRIDAFGEITASARRPFVMGDYYTADQLHEAIRAATERAAKAVEGVKPYAAITHVVEAEMRRRCAAAIRASGGMGAES